MRVGKAIKREPYLLTPPELYARLNAEHHFDFDPCPYPKPDGYDRLLYQKSKRRVSNGRVIAVWMTEL